MLINPAGKVLPCHAAEFAGMSFENVREKKLEWIWRSRLISEAFAARNGCAKPCRSCERRTEDFGGCRCQAYLLAGDATITDPACSLAPTHHLVESAVADANSTAALAQPAAASSFVQLQKVTDDLWSYRTNPE